MSLNVSAYANNLVGGDAREPDEIRASAMRIVEKAIKESIVVTGVEGAKVLERSACDEDDAEQALGYFDQKTECKLSSSLLKSMLIGLIIKKGACTDSSFWIPTPDGKAVVAFPLLAENRKKGSAQWALAAEIEEVLKKKQTKTNIQEFLEKTSTPYSAKWQSKLFAKGYTLLGDKKQALSFKKDMDKIIRSMESNKGVTSPVFEESLDFLS